MPSSARLQNQLGSRLSFLPLWVGSVSEDASTGFERHGQTIIGAVLLALLLWAGMTLLDVRDRLGRIETRQVAAVDRDRYLDTEIADLRRRLRDIELEAARVTNGFNGKR